VSLLHVQLALVVVVLSVPFAEAAPKGACAAKGKPVLLGTFGWGVDTVVTVGESSYLVATDTLRVWDQKGYGFPGSTYPLVPVAGGEVIALQAPKFDGFEQGAWSAGSWLGVGDVVVAVGRHPSRTGIVVARWRPPDPVPSVLQFETGVLPKPTMAPVGPRAAVIGETLAVVWTAPWEGLMSPAATKAVHKNEGRVMVAVVDLKTGTASKPVEVVEAKGWGTTAFGNVVPNADSTGFVVLQSVRLDAEEGQHPLSWRPLSQSGDLGEVKGQLPWDAWQSVLQCGGKLVAATSSSDGKTSKYLVCAADQVAGTVATTAIGSLGTIGCYDGTGSAAWVGPGAKKGTFAVRFALADGKPAAGIVVLSGGADLNVGRVAVASNKIGPVVLWNVMSKTTDHKDRADVYAQQMVCPK
jgi:hypothetical protein